MTSKVHFSIHLNVLQRPQWQNSTTFGSHERIYSNNGVIAVISWTSSRSSGQRWSKLILGLIKNHVYPHKRIKISVSFQNTALHLAAGLNKANAVSLLLSSNCAFLKNNLNATPLDIVVQLKHSEAALAIVGHEERWIQCKVYRFMT